MKKLLTFMLPLCFLVQHGYTQKTTHLNDKFREIEKKYAFQAWGDHVFLFNPGMDMKEVQALLDTIYNRQCSRKSEFSRTRYALLFQPGKYKLDIKVGYYMHIIGLGESPDDVVISGAVRSISVNQHNVLTSFWREAENLAVIPTIDSADVWAVSQAAALRRIHIKGDLRLHDYVYASGGFLADSKIDGKVSSGPQQQWFSRNTQWEKWKGGVWNMVFVGVKGAPTGNWPEKPFTVIPKTPLIREKPYLIYKNDRFFVKVPGLTKNTSGPEWLQEKDNEKTLSMDRFFIVKPGNTAEVINQALARGKNLLFTPGIYKLKKSINVTHPGTIVMGIGFPTLVPLNGNPVLSVSDVDDLTICGFITDAGMIPSQTLWQIGEPGSRKDHTVHPTFLFDDFFRVGGATEGSASSCLTINSNNVCIDHTWLWRADHGNGVGWNKNKCDNGLIVNGNYVTVYGLFNEHFQKYQTLWNGNHGRVYFYQSEMPYDPPSQDAWKHNGVNGYASYKVADDVTSHEAWGLGIYCVFRYAPVIVDNAIEVPDRLEKNIHHKIMYWLGGNKESIIKSLINGKGGCACRTNKKVIMN